MIEMKITSKGFTSTHKKVKMRLLPSSMRFSTSTWRASMVFSLSSAISIVVLESVPMDSRFIYLKFESSLAPRTPSNRNCWHESLRSIGPPSANYPTRASVLALEAFPLVDEERRKNVNRTSWVSWHFISITIKISCDVERLSDIDRWLIRSTWH
jgi:hypothetical protein